MKPINLLSLTQAYTSLNPIDYERFTQFYGITIKKSEVGDINTLIEILRNGQCNEAIFNSYYVGYKIPQIGKEFDLIRLGFNYNVNIEIKSNLDEVKMKQQLCRNEYYLKYLGKPLNSISFSSQDKNFYRLNSNGDLLQSNLNEVLEVLSGQDVEITKSIDDRFQPSNYLISPFNSATRFLSSEYFLTAQQEEIKSLVINIILGGKKAKFISLTGSAGTGKTLLAFDIVADLIKNGRTPLVVHCGSLNQGHFELMSAGWHIISIKHIREYDLKKFNVILIDEAQRIRSQQLSDLVTHVEKSNGCCIFSFDRFQTLTDAETRKNISKEIESVAGIVSFVLKGKIRTNKEIATFINALFNKSLGIRVANTGNIELLYFKDNDSAKNYISSLNEDEWKVIRFTPSQYDKEHHTSYSSDSSSTSHQVIGQEFDGVVVTIDNYFEYDMKGDLVYTSNAYYQPVKMLFQNITRTRNKLKIIIINNPTILDECLSILE